eukprot:6902554-Prymnesium_polylepis.1
MSTSGTNTLNRRCFGAIDASTKCERGASAWNSWTGAPGRERIAPDIIVRQDFVGVRRRAMARPPSSGFISRR